MDEIKKPHLICIEDFGTDDDDDDDDSGESGYVDGSGLPASIKRPERSASVGSSSSLNDSNQGKSVGLRFMNILQIAGGQSGSADQVDGSMVLAAPLSTKQKLSAVKAEMNKKSAMLLRTQNELIHRNSEYTLLQTNLERSKNEIDSLRQKLAESEKKSRILTSQMINLSSDSESGGLKVSQLEEQLRVKTEQLQNVQKERDELQKEVTKMEALLQKVEKGILEKIQRVQKPDAEIGLTPQGEVGPDLWRRICLLERELAASKDKVEYLKHKLQKKELRLTENEKRVSDVQAEVSAKDLILQRTEANLKQLQARVKWYSEILHKKEEQLSKLLAEKKERENEKQQVKPTLDKDKSKLEFALNKPNIFDILKKQLSSVPTKKVASAAMASAASAASASASGVQTLSEDEPEYLDVSNRDVSVDSDNTRRDEIKTGNKSANLAHGSKVEAPANRDTVSHTHVKKSASHNETVKDCVGETSKACASSNDGIFACFSKDLDDSKQKASVTHVECGNAVVPGQNNSCTPHPEKSQGCANADTMVKKEVLTEDIPACSGAKASVSQKLTTNTCNASLQPLISTAQNIPGPLNNQIAPAVTNSTPVPLFQNLSMPSHFGPSSSVGSYSGFLQPLPIPPIPTPQTVLGVNNSTNRSVSCPSFEDLQNSSGFFGDLLLPLNPELQCAPSETASTSRPPSFASISDSVTGLSTPSFGESLVPNITVKQEPMDVVEQPPNPVITPCIKEEPSDHDDFINSMLGLGKDKEKDLFEDSLLQLKSLIAAQSLPATSNDMDFSDDSNSDFASPDLAKHVQNFLNSNDDETPAGLGEDVVDGKKRVEESKEQPVERSVSQECAEKRDNNPTESRENPTTSEDRDEKEQDTQPEKNQQEPVKSGEVLETEGRNKDDDDVKKSEVASEESEDVEKTEAAEDSDDELEEGEIRDSDDEKEEFTWSADALKPVTRVECNVCGKMFLTEKLLSSHKRWHRQQNHCRDCGKTFLWQFQLSLHQHEQHGVKEEEEKAGGSGHVGDGNEDDVIMIEDGDDDSVCEDASDIEPFMDDDESDIESVEESVTSGNYDLEDELTNSEFETKSDTGSVVAETTDNITCEICHKTFRNKTALSMHSSVHTGFSYICTLCGKGYKMDLRYKQHLVNAHGLQQLESDECHTCEYCQKSYKTAMAKRDHMLTVHPERKHFTCTICKRSYHSFSQKQKHMIKSHPAWAPFMCQICRSTYNTSKALMQHIQEQHGSRAAQPVLPRKPAFHRMLKRYVTEPLPCPPPEKQHVTSVQGPLKLVIKTIKPDPDGPVEQNRLPIIRPEPKPVFVRRKNYNSIDCDICNLSFSFKAALKFHLMFAHPSATMHECKRCGMAYTIFKNLQAHKNTHKFTHRCYYCKKTFPKKSALQNHIKTHFPELKGLNLLLKSRRKRRVKVVKAAENLPPWW